MLVEKFKQQIKRNIADNELVKAFNTLKSGIKRNSRAYPKATLLRQTVLAALQTEPVNHGLIQSCILDTFDLLDSLRERDLRVKNQLLEKIRERWFELLKKGKRKEIIDERKPISPFEPSDDIRIKEKMNDGDLEETGGDSEEKRTMKGDEDEETNGLIGGFLGRLRTLFFKNNKGKIVCSIPRMFQWNRVNTVVVRISRADLADSILESGLEDSNLEKSEIELGRVMVVEIFEPSSDKSFEIVPLNNIEQVIDLSKDEYKEWEYHVKPLQKGFFTLVIRVSIVKKVSGLGAKKEDLIVWCKEVEVVIENANDAIDSIAFGQSWSNEKAMQLKEKLAKNKFGVVFQDLANILQFQDVALFNRLVALQVRWHQLENDNSEGLLEYEEWATDQTGITKALLILIDMLDAQGNISKIAAYKAELAHLEKLIAA